MPSEPTSGIIATIDPLELRPLFLPPLSTWNETLDDIPSFAHSRALLITHIYKTGIAATLVEIERAKK